MALAALLFPAALHAQITTFPWTEDFESEDVPDGFSFIDDDGDGNNWELVYYTQTAYGHNESIGLLMSASYYNYAALTPDNYAVLPAVQLPAASEFTLSWWEKAQDASYSDEYYSVYITAAGNTVSDFTATTPVYQGMATGEWTKRSVDLSSYAGQTVYIAFRHHNCTDMFYLDIDDLRIGEAEAPEVSLSNPGSVLVGEAVTFTANSDATTFAWTVDGTAQTSTTNTLAYTFTTGGRHTVLVTATNAIGSASDSLVLFVYDCTAGISDFPWTEGFENALNPCMENIDADDDGFQWEVYSDGFSNTGANSFVSFSYYSSSYYGYALTPDNWLILPAFSIPADATDFQLSWYAAPGGSADYLQEHYAVYAATTGTTTALGATTPLYEETISASGWVKHSVSLGSFAGQTIYIAFRHFDCTDMYALAIDDIYVGGPAVPVISAVNGPASAQTGMAVTFTAVCDDATSTFAWTVDGAAQTETSSTLTYTFTTDGTHTVSVTATNSIGTSAAASATCSVITCDPVTALPWDEGFEGDMDCWTLYTNTNDNGFYIYNSASYAHSGENFLAGGYNDYADVDQWAISPAITVPASGAYLNYYVGTTVYDGVESTYEVRVSTSGTAESDFSNLLHSETGSNMTEDGYVFEPRTHSLADYAGQTIRFAFHNITGMGGDVLLIDDVNISANPLGIDAAESADVALYPNPVTDVLNIRAEGVRTVELLDVNGRTVRTLGAASRVSLADLVEGVYIVRVTTATGVSTSKVVKK